MSDCIFCSIVNDAKHYANTIVARKSDFTVISPKNAITKGHEVVITNVHYNNMTDTPKVIFEALMGYVQERAQNSMENDTTVTGINILHATGVSAGQSVGHMHYHIVPRRPNDGLDLWLRESL